MADRYKLRSDGRKTRLCKGKNDTCTKEPKKDGLCWGCTTGRDATQFKNRQEGELFVVNNIRYKYVGGQSRQLCTGDDNTCLHLRKDGGNLCDGHANNTLRTPNAGLKVGDMMILNGIRYKFNGLQKCRMCDEVLPGGVLCEQIRIRENKCKYHSPYYWCCYTEHQCKRIRVHGDYCERHKNNILQPRKSSIGEEKIKEYLTGKGITFIHDKSVEVGTQRLRPDFMFDNCVIEFDGQQHFMAVELWKGEDGLQKRIEHDLLKDHWCIKNKKALLRISFEDIDLVVQTMDAFMRYVDEHSPEKEGYVVATEFYRSLNRGYTILG